MRGNIIISFPLTVIQVGLSHSQHLQKSPGKDFQVQIWTMPVTVPWLEDHNRANQWVGLTGGL